MLEPVPTLEVNHQSQGPWKISFLPFYLNTDDGTNLEYLYRDEVVILIPLPVISVGSTPRLHSARQAAFHPDWPGSTLDANVHGGLINQIFEYMKKGVTEDAPQSSVSSV